MELVYRHFVSDRDVGVGVRGFQGDANGGYGAAQFIYSGERSPCLLEFRGDSWFSARETASWV